MPAGRNCGGVVLHKGAGAPDVEAAAQRAMTDRPITAIGAGVDSRAPRPWGVVTLCRRGLLRVASNRREHLLAVGITATMYWKRQFSRRCVCIARSPLMCVTPQAPTSPTSDERHE